MAAAHLEAVAVRGAKEAGRGAMVEAAATGVVDNVCAACADDVDGADDACEEDAGGEGGGDGPAYADADCEGGVREDCGRGDRVCGVRPAGCGDAMVRERRCRQESRRHRKRTA